MKHKIGRFEVDSDDDKNIAFRPLHTNNSNTKYDVLNDCPPNSRDAIFPDIANENNPQNRPPPSNDVVTEVGSKGMKKRGGRKKKKGGKTANNRPDVQWSEAHNYKGRCPHLSCPHLSFETVAEHHGHYDKCHKKAGTKTYPCDGSRCTKHSVSWSNFGGHMSMHDKFNWTPFNCAFCNQRCSTKSNLINHIEGVHDCHIINKKEPQQCHSRSSAKSSRSHSNSHSRSRSRRRRPPSFNAKSPISSDDEPILGAHIVRQPTIPHDNAENKEKFSKEELADLEFVCRHQMEKGLKLVSNMRIPDDEEMQNVYMVLLKKHMAALKKCAADLTQHQNLQMDSIHSNESSHNL